MIFFLRMLACLQLSRKCKAPIWRVVRRDKFNFSALNFSFLFHSLVAQHFPKGTSFGLAFSLLRATLRKSQELFYTNEWMPDTNLVLFLEYLNFIKTQSILVVEYFYQCLGEKCPFWGTGGCSLSIGDLDVLSHQGIFTYLVSILQVPILCFSPALREIYSFVFCSSSLKTNLGVSEIWGFFKG